MSKRDLPERPHKYADWPVQPFWPTFIEKFLLAIIDANPKEVENGQVDPASDSRRTRLADAMNALFGTPKGKGRTKVYDLPAALDLFQRWYVEENRNEMAAMIGAPVTPGPSRRQASLSAASSTSGNSNASIGKRLERRAGDDDVGAYLRQVATLNYHQEEVDMMRDLLMVATILERWRTPMKVSAKNLGMASLWDKTPAD